MSYFTVNRPIKIEGRPFRPCICYEVTGYLDLTVQKLVQEGKAELHEHFVYFCNGKPVNENAKTFDAVEKPARKTKTKKIEPKEFKQAVEEITTPAEYEAEDGAEDF